MPLQIGQQQILGGNCLFYNGQTANPNFYQAQEIIALNSQNIANNSSNITKTLQVRSVNAGYWTWDNQTSIIHGVTLPAASFDTRATNVWQTIGSRTFDVPHNPDGSLALPVSDSFTTASTVSPYSLKSGSVSGSVDIVTIPRAAILNTFADFQIEVTAGAINGNLTIYSAGFSHYVQLFKNGVERANWTIAAGPVGSYNYALTLTAAQRNAIFGDMPSSESDVFTLVVTTFNAATQIGSSQSRTATGTIPVSYKPSITTANSDFSKTNKNNALIAYLIQNVSTLTLLLSGGSVPTGTSLSMYQVRFGTVSRQGTYTGAAISENVGLIAGSGTLYAYYSVKDSRGRWSDEISETLTVQAYNPPTNGGFKVQRNGSVATSADYVLKFSDSLYALGNTWTYTPYYWTGAYWQACKAATAIATASIDSVYTHALPYSESLVYNLKVVLTDLFNSAEYTDTLPTSAFPLSIGKKGCGFGKDTSDTYSIEAGALGISSDGIIQTAVGYDIEDTRGTTPTTNYTKRLVRFDFKSNTSDSLSNGGTFHTVMSLQQWADASGGFIHQLAFTDGDRMWHRSCVIGGTWGTWKQIAYNTDFQKQTAFDFMIPTNDVGWKLVATLTIPIYQACEVELIGAGIQQAVGSFGIKQVYRVSRESGGITCTRVVNEVWGSTAMTAETLASVYDPGGTVGFYVKSRNTVGATWTGRARCEGGQVFFG